MRERIDKTRRPVFSRRALMLGGVKIAMFTGLVGRMYYLQVVEGEQYRVKADENRISLRFLAPPRGRLLDRHGKQIARNRQNFRVLIIPEQAKDIASTLEQLNEIVPIGERERQRVLREVRRKRQFVPITVVDNLTWAEFSRINVRIPDLPGIDLDVGATRAYPFSDYLAHVVGYVAPVSERDLKEGGSDPLLELPGFRIGKRGLEKRFDTKLRGDAGTQRVEVNAYGRVIRELSRTEGRSGEDVHLTIDTELQQFVMDRLGDESAAAVVMDIHTGDVLALASVPSFNPNAFNVGLTSREWRALQRNPRKPLNNKAIAGRYPPGSTFKMVVILAALDAGVIKSGHQVYCNGKTQLGRGVFHCWKRGGHGMMNITEALAQSCDVFFYDIALKVGVDRIAAMAERFGLGTQLLPDLPGESSGLVPTTAWKEAAIGESWQKGETLIVGIGQGYLLSTPLQLATMTARLANGRFAVTPRIVKPGKNEKTEPFAELGVSKEALDFAREGMRRVMRKKRGTARAYQIKREGWEMAGKTGTAQVRRITAAERESGVLKNEELAWRERDHALFVAFAPSDKPKYAMSVIVEHGGSGSKTAAPIARDIMRRTQELDPSAKRRRNRDTNASTRDKGQG